MTVTIDGKTYEQRWVPVEEESTEQSQPQPQPEPQPQISDLDSKLLQGLEDIKKLLQKQNRGRESVGPETQDVNSILESIINGRKENGKNVGK